MVEIRDIFELSLFSLSLCIISQSKVHLNISVSFFVCISTFDLAFRSFHYTLCYSNLLLNLYQKVDYREA